MPVKQPTVSHHLKLLREAGLIDCERRGLWAYYFINAVVLLVAWASMRDLWMFYLIMAAIGTVMATVLYEPAFAIVAT